MNSERSKAMMIKEEAQSLLPHIEAALPAVAKKYLTPERLVKVALVAISRNPTLLACTKESILRAMIDAATLGLELAGPLGHVYAVPHRNGRTGQYELIPIVGYQGYLELARRSGRVAQVMAHVVYSNDVFELDLGGGKPPRHIVRDWKARGEPLLAYCVARFADGNHHVEVMTMPEIEAVRARSRAKDSGPWVTDYLEMCRKTVVRRARKYWPMIPELAMAAEIDERGIEAPPISIAENLPAEQAPPTRTDQAKAILSDAATTIATTTTDGDDIVAERKRAQAEAAAMADIESDPVLQLRRQYLAAKPDAEDAFDKVISGLGIDYGDRRTYTKKRIEELQRYVAQAEKGSDREPGEEG